MKKTLTLLLALFAIGVTSSVRAEEVFEFRPEGEQKLPGVIITPFKVGDQSINIMLEPNGYVYASLSSDNGNKVKKPEPKTYEVPCSNLEKLSNPSCEGRKWSVSGNRASSSGSYTVYLEKPLTSGDVIKLTFADNGNFYFGELTFISEKRQKERIKKEKEAEEALQKKEQEKQQKQLEESMLKQIREEDHKSWHQRLSESIQDQWWNFKGLFQ
ncbi:phage protein [Streptococcus pyogenes]|uniref:hypothetical protein n=1 Tax=Streptococcus pyogenes TaxID=1314 RepID=UPI0010A1B02C|nr:hypothetical protein [Streptococcus pyogenes]VGR67822.1 phage protein [Streptococcus pyogenes]